MKQPDIEELPGFEELFQKSIDKFLQEMPIEERLAGLAPEQVVGAFAPEQMLNAFSPEQLILALPVDVLRGLSADCLCSLPAEVQEQIAKRLQGSAH